MSHRHTVPRQRIGRRQSQPTPSDIARSYEDKYAPKTKRYLGNPLRLARKKRSMTTCLLQMVAMFSIVFLYFYFTERSSQTCFESDPMCPDRYFTETYNKARQKFISLSNKIHDSKTYNLPITTIKSDKEYGVEQTLFTDITIINADAKKSDHLLIHISGIHGIEGFAGSAIQCGILSEMAEMTIAHHLNKKQRRKEKKGHEYTKELLYGMLVNHQRKKWMNHDNKTDDYDINDFPVIMFVHSLNPYGMYHGMRVNENNVDLNRNLKTKKEWNMFKTDERNKYDDDIDDLLNPNYDIQSTLEWTDWIPLVKFFRLNWVIHYVYSYMINWLLKTRLYGWYAMKDYDEFDDQGRDTIFERYTVGQNYDPNGLQYVGTEQMEKSHIVFKQFLRDIFKENEWSEQFKKITLIDIHTGYGEYGKDIITVSNDDHLEQAQNIGKTLRIRPLIKSMNYQNKNFANGIYKNVNGMSYEYIDFIVNELMDSNNNVDKLGLLQHFGTYSREYMLDAVRFSHSYNREYKEFLESMNGDSDEDKDKLKLIGFMKEYARDILHDAFYVKDIGWKRKVVQSGWDTFVQLYRR